MTNYKNIFGKPVKFLATDPDNAEAEGQVWYNSTSGTFKSIVALEAWSSGASGIQARRLAGGTGTQTATLAVGGVGPNPTVFNNTEEYNGSGWSSDTNYPTQVYGVAACGTQTSALLFGGVVPSPAYTTATNTYDGSTYSSVNALNTGRAHSSNNIGTQTSALAAGGGEPLSSASEEWDGTSWASGNPINTARQGIAAGGIQTAAFIAGGEGPGPAQTAASEEYDGTSWTTGNPLNTARIFVSGTGPQTAGIAFAGGEPANSNKTETYDGTSWTAAPTLATARQAGMGAGTSNSSAIAAFGATGPTALLSITEEYNKSINVITAAAWSAGGNLNTSRRQVTGAGLQTAALSAGGFNDTATINNTEEYNGSTWANASTMPEGKRLSATFGTQTAAIDATGIGSTTYSTTTQSYDGSTWTSGLGAVNTGRYANNCFGTSIAALINGGQDSVGFTNASEEWDGTSWAAGTASSNTKYQGYHSGTQTAGLIAGGSAPPATNTSEEWNGSAWSSGGNLLYPATAGNASNNGTQTSTIVFAGTVNGSPDSVITQGYDGSAWSTRPSLGTGRGSPGGAGTANSALAFGGNSPVINTTEEFTGETSAINIKTLTTS